MKYLSVCSGIEAATVAWHGLGWKAAAYSEIEAFPSAVLAHHYPDIPNVGDMTKFKEWNIEPGTIDLLVGGAPCQSFSVAGLRKGLADPRGNLALVYCGILDHLKPRWFVWENVPGVLSSGGGRDFGSFLGAVAELGYGFAYRVLDAQFFGVAQRRRRVFVVGYLGDWRPAAKVLFERESLRGDSAPSREKGKAVAGRVTHGLGVSGECARALTAAHTVTGRLDPHEATFVSQAIAWDEEMNASIEQAGTLLRGGAGGRHDGVMQPIANALTASRSSTQCPNEDTTLVMQPIALQDITPREKAQNGRGWNDDGTAYTVDTAATQGVLAPTLTASNDPSRSPQSSEITAQVAAVVQAMAAVGTDCYNGAITGDVAATMGTPGSSINASGPTVMTGMQVRRLTPVECERLQGFHDNYTAIPWRGKAETPDGPRYKALGNSMAVPVMAWIGRRIQEFEAGNAS